MRRLPGAPFVLAFLLTGCRSGEPVVVTRTDSAGVEVVSNVGLPPVVTASMDTTVIFGGEDSGPAGFYRVRRPLVDLDPSGLIYVLDPVRHQVAAFSADGDFVGAWGREGEGPGELRSPLSVAVSGQGLVTVHDPGRGVFVTYAADGSLAAEEPAPYSVIYTGLRHLEVTEAGFVFWVRDPPFTVEPRMDRLVAASAGDTTELVSGRPAHRSSAYHPACATTFSVSVPLSPSIHWSEWGGRIAVAAWADDRIDVFEGADLTRQVHFGPAIDDLTRAEAVALLEARGIQGPCNSAPADFVAKHGFFPRPQTIRDLTVEPGGGIWVLYRESGSSERIMVFDSTGAAGARLPRDFPMPLAFLPDGRALIQVVDSFDVERLGVATIRAMNGDRAS